ncbi:hypothetical protein K504DRAFT_463784 [Pleomassaria siparia CBS 279.74]|uniref:DNA glycosylase n=1 Tax=Pleomassaria siparia CBS 279.74 TaxID=1314801 RepID=A0A6G1JSD2_9PLEO|nr:hypothetical protein K504DRAFT_463784 [Pleomassaria siparia CBS 279.74]
MSRLSSTKHGGRRASSRHHHKPKATKTRKRKRKRKVKKPQMAAPNTESVNVVSSVLDEPSKELCRIREQKNSANGLNLNQQQHAAALHGTIIATEKICNAIEGLATSFLPILNEDLFKPELWILQPLRVAHHPSGTAISSLSEPPRATTDAKTAERRRSDGNLNASESNFPSYLPRTEKSSSVDGGSRTPTSSTSPLSTADLNSTPVPAPALKPKKKKKTAPTVSPYFLRTEKSSSVNSESQTPTSSTLLSTADLSSTPVPAPAPAPKPTPKPKPKKRSTPTTSPYFYNDPFSAQPTPKGLCFELQPAEFGLIQERIRTNLFALVVQTILWNQTTAKAARPVLFQLLCTYPTPEALSVARREDVFGIIRTLGLQEKRTDTLLALGKKWVDAPPDPTRRYARRNYYPTSSASGSGPRPEDRQLLHMGDKRPGWEIAHLPGIGPYALDSYRIFYRDTLWGVEHGDGLEPEWKRVVPLDKDLRAYLVWKWKQEGWIYHVQSGTRSRMP